MFSTEWKVVYTLTLINKPHINIKNIDMSICNTSVTEKHNFHQQVEFTVANPQFLNIDQSLPGWSLVHDAEI